MQTLFNGVTSGTRSFCEEVAKCLEKYAHNSQFTTLPYTATVATLGTSQYITCFIQEEYLIHFCAEVMRECETGNFRRAF